MKYPKPKDNYLQMSYGKIKDNPNPDVIYNWGDGCSKSDSRLLFYIFNHLLSTEPNEMKTPLEELENRGYDITTIEFSIKKKIVNKTNI